MAQKIYDVIIIGGGPAGLTAGIYTARIGLRTLILESQFLGGRALEAYTIENFPGFPEGISGEELAKRMIQQAEKFGAEIKSSEVISMDLNNKNKVVITKTAKYLSHALILSTGTQRKKLLVSGEEEFLGRGVSYCAVCDGPLFRGRVVAVIGSGNEAAEDALMLAEFADKVLLITDKEELAIAENLRRKLDEKGNVKLLLNIKVKAIEGDIIVKAVKAADIKSNKEQKIPVDAVFVSLGRIPMTQLIKKSGIEVDERGCIKIDRRQRTNMEGVFAAGDCTCGGMQIATAVGEGARAAMMAAVYVKKARNQET